jgi:hypothetical protein
MRDVEDRETPKRKPVFEFRKLERASDDGNARLAG